MNQSNFVLKPWLLCTLVVLTGAASTTWGQSLVLQVNVTSGNSALVNPSSSPVTIDAYTLLSTAADGLNPAGWESFNSNGFSLWDEANPSNIHISETSLLGNRVVTNAAAIDLGNPVTPVLPAQLTTFGVVPNLPVQFQYHVASGTTQTGQVVFVGNTLELLVDPSTGQARIVNPTPFNLQMDAYSIVSLAGSLNPSGWQSLDDAGQPGWDEATNSSSKHLSEMNLTGSRSITKEQQGAPIALGNLFGGGAQDLQFTFHAAAGAAPGDYNEDGIVNLADYTVWRDNVGAPAGTLPNDSDGGEIGSAQYLTWKANFGESAGGTFQTYTGVVRYVSLAPLLGTSVAVPEPSAYLIAAMMVGVFGLLRVRKQSNLLEE